MKRRTKPESWLQAKVIVGLENPLVPKWSKGVSDAVALRSPQLCFFFSRSDHDFKAENEGQEEPRTYFEGLKRADVMSNMDE